MPTTPPNAPAASEAERIGATVKALRKSYGLTAEKLGAAIGVTGRYIYKIESGSAGLVDVVLLRKIADAIKISLAAIVVEGYDQLPDISNPDVCGACGHDLDAAA